MKIIAHRGASGDFPENTLQAFEQAIVQQCDGIELDVHYHPSGELVVIHNNYFATTTNKRLNLAKASLAELESHHIPTLDQALKKISGRCLVNIEIKISPQLNQNSGYFIKTLLTQLEYANSHYHFNWSLFIISSFNHLLLKELYQNHSNILLAALFSERPQSLNEVTQLPLVSINPAFSCLTIEFVKAIHQYDLEAWVYTVNNSHDIHHCLNLGIDAIFTDYPDKSRHHCNYFNSKSHQ